MLRVLLTIVLPLVLPTAHEGTFLDRILSAFRPRQRVAS